MNDKILTLIGKLSLAKALIKSANLSVYDAVERHELNRISLDKKNLKAINRILSDINYSKSQLDDVIFDLSTELLKILEKQE